MVVLVVLAGLGWILVQRAGEARRRLEARRPQVEGRIEVQGLAAPLRILRDARGVPHVEAASERDAYFGLGFVHAQDRLGQMLSLLLSARGRGAEVAGEESLPADRLARVLGIGALADRQAAALDVGTAELLRAYSAGVDARLARLRAGLGAPPGQLERDALPVERWLPADSIAVLKAWSWGLSGSLDASLVLDDLLRALGPVRARPFFPAGAGVAPLPGQGPPKVARALGWPTPVNAAGAPGTVNAAGAPFGDPLRRALGLEGSGVGSSAWVLSGAKSASGKPLLAADAHLEPTVPAHYYQVHLRGGALDVAGATLPGLPVIWSGANRRVAWAATAARASVMDLFIESLEPARDGGAGRYHDGERWRPVLAREEQLAVRGGRADASLSVLETRHGPLVNDLLAEPREPLALAWASAQPGDGIGPLLRVARAGDGAALVAALAVHHEPALAFAWIDADGNGGMQVAGWIPRRPLPSGLVPVSGRSAWAEWQGRHPPEHLPAARVGPGRDVVVVADAALEAGPGRRMEWLWRTGERARRIEALLGEAAAPGGVTARQMAALQLDVVSGGAERILEPVLELAGSPAQLGPEEREVLALLRDWDRQAARDSVGAAVYHVFLGRLTRALLEPVLGPTLYERYVGLAQANPAAVVARVLAAAAGGRPGSPQGSPEWTRARVREALQRTLRETWLHFGVTVGPNRDKWSWGRLHALEFRPFGLLRWAQLPERALGPHEYPGDPTSVAAGAYAFHEPFAVRTASTHRLVADAAELDTLLVSMAPGQVEEPAHPHRADQVEAWLAGRPALLVTSAVLLEEQAVARLELVPEVAP